MPTISTAELCKIAGVSRVTLGNWAAKGMPGKVARGKWDSDLCLPWIAALNETKEPAPPDDLPGRNDTAALRARLVKLQGDNQKIRNDLLLALLVRRERVDGLLQEAAATQIAVGNQWVREGRTAEDLALRRELWDGLRTRIAESYESIARSLDAGEDMAPARVRIPG